MDHGYPCLGGWCGLPFPQLQYTLAATNDFGFALFLPHNVQFNQICPFLDVLALYQILKPVNKLIYGLHTSLAALFSTGKLF